MLKLVGDDVHAPLLHRVQSLFSLGFVLNAKGEPRSSASAYAHSVELGNRAIDDHAVNVI